jgi:hypothetical protein
MLEPEIELDNQFHESLDKYQQTINQLLEQISKRNQRILLLKADQERLLEKEQAIQRLSASLAEQSVRFQQQDADIQQHKGHIQQLEAHIQQLEAHIQRQEAQTQQQEAHIWQQETYIQSLVQQLEAIKRTKVWQLATKWYGFKHFLAGSKQNS